MKVGRYSTHPIHGGFVRSVGLLVGGTTFAHAISALALPVLTRLYAPSDFSMLAIFSSLVSIIAVGACLRFDVAVSIPEKDADAVNILALALACVTLVSALLAIAVLSFPQRVVVWLNHPSLERHLWLFPMGVMLAGCYSALQFWFVRRMGFGLIARTRVGQSVVSAGTQVGLGSLGTAPTGLLIGYILNPAVACIVFGYRILQIDCDALRAVSWPRMRALFTEYIRFPKYSTVEALSNSAAIQVPIIIIAALAIGPEAGYLMLAMQVMQAPMALIGVSIGQVYLSRAPDEYRAGRLGVFTADTFGGLIKTGVGPLVFVGIVSPNAFAVIFGDEWQRAGFLVLWMTPWFVVQFLASPISMALHVTSRQRAALALQVFGLILRVGAILGASVFAINILAEVYALSGFVFYLVYLMVVMRVIAARPSDVARGIRGGISIVVMWVVGGCAVALTINTINLLK